MMGKQITKELNVDEVLTDEYDGRMPDRRAGFDIVDEEDRTLL